MAINISLGLKFANNLAMYSESPCDNKNSPVEMSKKEIPILLLIKIEAKKLFFFGYSTPSTEANPGVTSSVTPLFTIFFVFFGSSN